MTRPPELSSLTIRDALSFTSLVSSITDYAICVLDPEGNVLTWNAGAQLIKGYYEDEILGQHFSRFYSEEDIRQKRPEWLIEHAMADGRVEDEGWRVRKDGSRFWANVVMTALQDEDGHLRGFVKVMRDLTERRRAEEQRAFLKEASTILASSLDYETTLETVAHLTVPALADWCLVDIVAADNSIRRLVVAAADPKKNDVTSKLWRRYAPDINIRRGVPEVLRTGRSLFIPAVRDEVLVGAAKDSEHLQLLRSVGPKAVMIVPLVARERTLGAITVMMAESGRCYTPADLSQAEELAHVAALAIENARLYREAQEALAREQSARLEAEHASQRLQQFLGMVAHDVREPLGVVATSMEVVRESPQRQQIQVLRKLLPSIESATRRTQRLVEDLLDAARIGAGRFYVRTGSMDLGETVRNVAKQAQATTKRHRIIVLGPEHVEGAWDVHRISQLFINLMSNAIKYSPNSGDVRVTLSLTTSDVMVSIADQGVGIPEEQLPRLFQPFSRLSPDETKGEGLGLYIARAIAEAHGGSIWVDSEVGKGSTFYVAFPLTSHPA